MASKASKSPEIGLGCCAQNMGTMKTVAIARRTVPVTHSSLVCMMRLETRIATGGQESTS